MRSEQTVAFTPARRPVYRQAGILGQEQGGDASPFARSTEDWVQGRNQKRLSDHLDARSNIGDGRDAITAMAAGQRLTVVSLGAGLQIRVPHQLNRKPSAVVWYRTQDPNNRLTGNPDGKTGAFANSAWTAREVFVTTNAPAGIIFDVSIG